MCVSADSTKTNSCTCNGNLFISIGFLPIAKSMSHKQQAFGRSMSEVNPQIKPELLGIGRGLHSGILYLTEHIK